MPPRSSPQSNNPPNRPIQPPVQIVDERERRIQVLEAINQRQQDQYRRELADQARRIAELTDRLRAYEHAEMLQNLPRN